MQSLSYPMPDVRGLSLAASGLFHSCVSSLLQTRNAALLLLFSAAASSAPQFEPQANLPPATAWKIDADALCQVATKTEAYLAKGEGYDPHAIHPGSVFSGLNITLSRVKQTLSYICQIAGEDKQAARPSRLNDPDFVKQHFQLLRWRPDLPAAKQLADKKSLLRNLPDDQLLITRYYLHKATAAEQQQDDFPYALYGLPYDERQLSLEQAEQLRDQLTRYRYGKQQVLKGVVKQQAPALVWLKREDLEAALMQGTLVAQSGSQQRVFNVHRNNGIGYDRALKPYDQQRYWYFKQVPQIMGYGKDADFKIPVLPKVTVAGDLKQLGLGKLILMRRNEAKQPVYRMAVLADTGGAFANNLFQLDWLSGAYQGREDYQQANRHMADYAQVWLLLKR